LPFGIGHFYCKRYLIWFIKILVLLIIPSIGCFINRKYFGNKENNSHLIKISIENNKGTFIKLNKLFSFLFTIYFLLIFFIWYVFDLVIFSSNKHKDGSGFDLIPI
jgi:hypothetical protein